MPSRNYDSSFLTQKRQAQILRAFYDELQVGYSNGTTIKREQPTLQSSRIIAERNQPFAFTVAFPIGFSPSQGPIGTFITITGLNLVGPVKINGFLTTLVSNNGTTMIVQVPEGTTSGALTINGVQAGIFTVTGGATTISGFTPEGGFIGDQVTITGTNLKRPVYFYNNVEVTNYISESATEFVVQVPEGAETGPITVNGVSTDANFIIITGDTVIDSYDPQTGSYGTTVTITGSNLIGPVTFNGTLATISSNDGFTMVVTVPVGATTGSLVVNGVYAGEFEVSISYFYVAAGDFNNTVYSSNLINWSTDGSNWNPVNTTIELDELENVVTNGSNVYLTSDFNNNTIYRSTDGSNWSIVPDIFLGLATLFYTNGKFYSLETNLQSSTDGLNWSSFITSGDITAMKSIEYGNGIYNAFGINDSNAGLYSSTDGSNWNQNTIEIDNSLLVFKNNIWIVSNNNNTSYAINGSNWTPVRADSPFTLDCLTYGNGVWVGGKKNGSNWTSTDASNWSSHLFPSGVTQQIIGMQNVIFDGTKFIGTADNTIPPWDRTHMVQISTDGSNWTPTPDTNTMVYNNGLTYNSGTNRYVMTGYINESTKSFIETSSNTSNWTPANKLLLNGTELLNIATNGSNIYVGAISVGLTYVYTSTDSSNWNAYLVTDYVTSYNKIMYLNDRFYAVGLNGSSENMLASSTDGSNWTATGPAASMARVLGIAYGNGLYVLTGKDTVNTPVSFTSTDGSTWDSNASYFGNFIDDLQFGNNLWVGCYQGSVYTSTDGSNWGTTSASGFNSAYGNGVWVTTTQTNTYSYSTDNGATWNAGYYLTDSSMYVVHFDGSNFIAGGQDFTDGSQTFQTSSDGINWSATNNDHNFSIVKSIVSKIA